MDFIAQIEEINGLLSTSYTFNIAVTQQLRKRLKYELPDLKSKHNIIFNDPSYRAKSNPFKHFSSVLCTLQYKGDQPVPINSIT